MEFAIETIACFHVRCSIYFRSVETLVIKTRVCHSFLATPEKLDFLQHYLLLLEQFGHILAEDLAAATWLEKHPILVWLATWMKYLLSLHKVFTVCHFNFPLLLKHYVLQCTQCWVCWKKRHKWTETSCWWCSSRIFNSTSKSYKITKEAYDVREVCTELCVTVETLFIMSCQEFWLKMWWLCFAKSTKKRNFMKKSRNSGWYRYQSR